MTNPSLCGTALLDVVVAVSAALQTVTTSKAGIVDTVRAHLGTYDGQSLLLLLDGAGTLAHVRMATPPASGGNDPGALPIEGRTFPLVTVPTLQQIIESAEAQFFPQGGLLAGETMLADTYAPADGTPNDPHANPTICAPLLVDDEVQGVIAVSAEGLTRADVPVVAVLANCIAFAFIHLHTISSVQESGERYSALIEQANDGQPVAEHKRGDILQAAAMAATRLLHEQNWQAGIEKVLAHLGEAAQVSRVYVFENHTDAEGTLRTSYRFEWTAPGITSQLDNPALQNLPYDAAGYRRWRKILGGGDIIHGAVCEFPSGERELLQAQKIVSIVVLPIFVDSEWWGFMGFDECKRVRDWSPAEFDALQTAANTLGAAIHRERTELAIQHYVDKFHTQLQITETLQTASALVTSAVEQNDILDTILDLLQQAVAYDSASILLLNDENELQLAVGRGYPDLAAVRRAIPALRKKLEVMFPEAGAVVVPDTHDEERWIHIPETEYIRSWVGAPLTVKGRLIGTLNVDNRIPYAYDESTAETVMAFANQAAIAIENARLFSETKLALSREHQLTEITRTLSGTLDLPTVLKHVVRRAADVTGADAGALALVSSDGQRMTYPYLCNLPDHLVDRSAPRGEGVAWHVVETGSSVLRSDYATSPHALPNWVEAGIHAILAVPLTTGDSYIGVLGLFKRVQGKEFSERDRVLAEAIGRQAGVAIRNARLHQQTERRAQRLAVLHQIDSTIATGSDLRLTLDVILQQVTAQLDVDAADILLTGATPNTLEYAAGHGFRTNALQNTRFRLSEGYAGRAVRERNPVFIEDLREDAGGLEEAPFLPDEDFVSYYAMPLLTKGHVKGVLEFFYRRRVMPDSEWHQFMRTLAGQAAISIDNAQLFEDLQRSNAELARAYDATLAGWARALELRDIETEGHSQRVTRLTVRLARAMGVPEEEIEQIRRGARLHDIGKMGISDSILLKPGPLSEEEWELMRLHPVYAYEMLESIEFLTPALDIPRYHHEKWDGSGYPDGLEGEEIPLSARIFAVVDVYDALTSYRPYRDPWSEEDALIHIREQAGVHFDPDIVETFLRFIEEYR